MTEIARRLLDFKWSLLFIFGLFHAGCQDIETQSASSVIPLIESTHTKEDSIELTALVRDVYERHVNDHTEDFPYKYDNDTIFSGIDWQTYNKNIEKLRKQNFFTHEFFESHKRIAKNIDSSMRTTDIKWRNIKDGIPLWSTNADDWCGCQDNPDQYWKVTVLKDIVIKGDSARFHWNWDDGSWSDSHKYEMTAKKVDDHWKVNSMEGFKNYGTVADYKKLMKE